MKLTLKSEYLKASVEHSDDVRVDKMIEGMITVLEAQGYVKDSIYRCMREVLEENDPLEKEDTDVKLPSEEEEKPKWDKGKNGKAVFEFADGTTMTKFTGEVVRGLYKHGENGSMRPVKVTFTKDFLTFNTKAEEEWYDRWVQECYEALDTKAREALAREAFNED